MTTSTADALRQMARTDANLGIDGDIHVDQALFFVKEARKADAEARRQAAAASARAFLDFAFGDSEPGCR